MLRGVSERAEFWLCYWGIRAICVGRLTQSQLYIKAIKGTKRIRGTTSLPQHLSPMKIRNCISLLFFFFFFLLLPPPPPPPPPQYGVWLGSLCELMLFSFYTINLLLRTVLSCVRVAKPKLRSNLLRNRRIPV